MIKQILYLLCSWIMIQGCTTNSQQLPEITLSYDAPTVQMKFSEIADNLQIIRLETSDSMLIPDFFVPCIGEKYIVAEYSGATHLYSKDGKYIHKILTEGRGPEEYLIYYSGIIDHKTNKFFMTDGENHLFSYDLKERKLLERQKIPYTMKLFQSSGDTLLCYPFYLVQKMTCPYLFCAYNPQGEIINQLTDTIIDGSMYILSVCSSAKGEIRLKTYKSDTVYTINNFNKIPAYIVQGTSATSHVPLSINLHAETNKDYFFRTYSMKVGYNEKGVLVEAVEYAPSRTFRVNKKNYFSEIVDKMYIDTLGITLPITSIHFETNTPYFTLSAFQFREALREKAEKHELSPDMQKLYEEVKEDDNPLIFIGQYKK